jgi:hypothetical protein
MCDLKLVPAHVMRHTSFVARLPASEVFGKIQTSLQNPRFGITVDVRPPTNKFKLKGLGISGGTKTVFSINLFRNQSCDVVVECARLEGCTVLFNRLYQQLLASLGDVVVRRLESNSHRIPACSLSCPSVSMPCTSSLSVISRLLDRALSPYLDEQLEACEALLAFSHGESARVLLGAADGGVVKVLDALLRSDSEDAVRMGAQMFKNLLEETGLKEKLPARLLSHMFELLDGPITYTNRDAKRHISAGLRCIDKTCQYALSSSQRLALQSCH